MNIQTHTLLVTAVLLAAAPGIVAGAQINATVTDVDISPAEPAPGEPVTFRTTIQNIDTSTDPLKIMDIAIRDAGGGLNEYTRVRDIGTISPGTEITVPLTHTFESAGTYDLRVIAYTRNANTNKALSFRYPVLLTVRERHPQMQIDTNESTVGVPTDGSVTVANGLNTTITNVEVTISGETVTMLDNESIFATINSGETVNGSFRFQASEAEPQTLTGQIRYRLPDGTKRSETVTHTIRPERAENDTIKLTEINVQRSGSEFEISGSTANVDTKAVQSVIVRVRDADGVNPVQPNKDFFVGEVPASDFSSFTLTAQVERSVTELPVTVSYVRNGVSREIQTAIPMGQSASVQEPVNQQPEPDPSGESQSGLPVVLIGVVGLILAVSAVVFFRRYRKTTVDLDV
jgi:hypothetical protein